MKASHLFSRDTKSKREKGQLLQGRQSIPMKEKTLHDEMLLGDRDLHRILCTGPVFLEGQCFMVG